MTPLVILLCCLSAATRSQAKVAKTNSALTNPIQYFKQVTMYNISRNKSFVIHAFERNLFYVPYKHGRKRNESDSLFSILTLESIVEEGHQKQLRYGNVNVAFMQAGHIVDKMLVDYRTYGPQAFSKDLIRDGLKDFKTLTINKAGIVFKEVAIMCKDLVAPNTIAAISCPAT